VCVPGSVIRREARAKVVAMHRFPWGIEQVFEIDKRECMGGSERGLCVACVAAVLLTEILGVSSDQPLGDQIWTLC